MAKWIAVDRIKMREDVVFKTEIPIEKGLKLVVENDSRGQFVSATIYKGAKPTEKLKPCEEAGKLTLNGMPITYISPGSVIIAEGSICYTQRCPDGRTITVCYPRGSCPGVG